MSIADRLTGVPRNEVGLFNKVGLRSIGAPALSATLGVSFATNRESGLPNDPDGSSLLTVQDVRLPSCTEVSADLIWDKPGYTLGLNKHNLTDENLRWLPLDFPAARTALDQHDACYAFCAFVDPL